MPDQGDAEILQILARQARQDPLVDLVLAERQHIALKAQILQPRRYVHAVIPGSEKRQPLMDDDIPLPVDLPAAALQKPTPRRRLKPPRATGSTRPSTAIRCGC